MRTPLLMIALLAAAPLYAEERTWTIARDVFTTKAELVAVRGDLAYLKIDGKIEQYPIVRLSAVDQRYIASLSLAPVLPGPGEDGASEILPTASAVALPSVLPTPGGQTTDMSVLRSGPMLVPPVTEEAIPLPSVPTPPAAGSRGRTSRSSNYGNTAPPSAMSNQAPYRSTNTQSQNTLNNSNARRGTQSSQQSQQQRRSTTGQQNQQEPQGLLNLRGRRNDRGR